MMELLGGIAFGIPGIGYSVYLFKDWDTNSHENSFDYGYLFKGILGAGILLMASVYCFYKFFVS